MQTRRVARRMRATTLHTHVSISKKTSQTRRAARLEGTPEVLGLASMVSAQVLSNPTSPRAPRTWASALKGQIIPAQGIALGSCHRPGLMAGASGLSRLGVSNCATLIARSPSNGQDS